MEIGSERRKENIGMKGKILEAVYDLFDVDENKP